VRQPDDDTALLHSLLVGSDDERHFLCERLITAADPLVLRGEPRITCANRSRMERHHFLVYAMLSMINSPAVFHRDRHEPHRAVAREAKTKGLGEIKDWHKIRLSITREVSEAVGESITGERCLHFVRMFTRWRLGRLEYVKDHWRGNPEKGASLTSYKVRP
jgi:hypothetical protein